MLFLLLSSTSFRLKGERLFDLAAEQEDALSEGRRDEGEDDPDISPGAGFRCRMQGWDMCLVVECVNLPAIPCVPPYFI